MSHFCVTHFFCLNNVFIFSWSFDSCLVPYPPRFFFVLASSGQQDQRDVRGHTEHRQQDGGHQGTAAGEDLNGNNNKKQPTTTNKQTNKQTNQQTNKLYTLHLASRTRKQPPSSCWIDGVTSMHCTANFQKIGRVMSCETNKGGSHAAKSAGQCPSKSQPDLRQWTTVFLADPLEKTSPPLRVRLDALTGWIWFLFLGKADSNGSQFLFFFFLLISFIDLMYSNVFWYLYIVVLRSLILSATGVSWSKAQASGSKGVFISEAIHQFATFATGTKFSTCRCECQWNKSGASTWFMLVIILEENTAKPISWATR